MCRNTNFPRVHSRGDGILAWRVYDRLNIEAIYPTAGYIASELRASNITVGRAYYRRIVLKVPDFPGRFSVSAW